MNILCDFHHSDLWWSHHLIFEKALGHKLYRPRGMEWFDRGYYYQSQPHVAAQYLINSMLKIETAPSYPRVHKPLLSNANVNEHGMMMSMDTISGCKYYPFMRTISLEEFADTKIDVIMPTISNNQEPWLRLKHDLKPTAKLIREEGNVNGWASLHSAYRNVITSDLPTFQKSSAPNKVHYHQRFDTENIFTYSPPTVFNRITCFMPGFRGTPDLVAFTERHDFGGMEFFDYGHQSKRGFLTPKEKFAVAMRDTSFVWHVKPGGDGFGHNIHSSFAMGRPVITVANDYRHSIVWPLLSDGETCILIGGDPVENSKKIKSMSDSAKITEMSLKTVKRFKDVVNYDAESDQIRIFLERLV